MKSVSRNQSADWEQMNRPSPRDGVRPSNPVFDKHFTHVGISILGSRWGWQPPADSWKWQKERERGNLQEYGTMERVMRKLSRLHCRPDFPLLLTPKKQHRKSDIWPPGKRHSVPSLCSDFLETAFPSFIVSCRHFDDLMFDQVLLLVASEAGYKGPK